MLKLSLSIVCFICLSSLLYAGQEKSRIGKLDSKKIIAIFKGKDYKKKIEVYELFNKKLKDGTLQKSNIEELDKIFGFCSASIKKFPWDKYLLLPPDELKNLSKTKSEKVSSDLLMLEILVIGKMLNNPNAVKFASYLEEKSKTSSVEKILYKAWRRSLSNLERHKNFKEARKLLASGYANCRKKLMDIIEHKEYSKKPISLCFLILISNNSVFLAEFKKDKQAKEQLLANIKKQFPTIKGKLIKNRAVRTAFVNLFYRLESPKDAIKWLETVIKMPNISAREKQSIQQNRINDLKRSLDIPIE